jgi:hypothetical protein
MQQNQGFRYEMARESRTRPDNQESARKPRPGQRIGRVQKQPRGVARLDPTAHWGKIFQKDFEKFQKKGHAQHSSGYCSPR